MLPATRPATHQLPVSHYRFHATLLDDWMAPFFEGSALRGAFGHALRRAACMTRMRECAPCPLRQRCPYTTLFEATTAEQESMPNPYVLNTTRPLGHAALPAGQTYTFGMTLMGLAASQLALVIWAWQKALERGLGRDRIRMRLERVTLGDGPTIWSRETPEVSPHSGLLCLPPAPGTEHISLELITPCQIRHNGQFLSPGELNVRILAFSLARRLQAALPNQPRIALPPLDGIRLTEHTRWTRWWRRSNRQQRRMAFGGLTGTLQLEGDWHALWPLLWYGQWLNLGRHSTFGMGRYRLLMPPEHTPLLTPRAA